MFVYLFQYLSLRNYKASEENNNADVKLTFLSLLVINQNLCPVTDELDTNGFELPTEIALDSDASAMSCWGLFGLDVGFQGLRRSSAWFDAVFGRGVSGRVTVSSRLYTRFRNVTNRSIIADFHSSKHCDVA